MQYGFRKRRICCWFRVSCKSWKKWFSAKNIGLPTVMKLKTLEFHTFSAKYFWIKFFAAFLRDFIKLDKKFLWKIFFVHISTYILPKSECTHIEPRYNNNNWRLFPCWLSSPRSLPTVCKWVYFLFSVARLKINVNIRIGALLGKGKWICGEKVRSQS